MVCLPGTPVNQPYPFIALQPDSSETAAACCQADDDLISCIPASVEREALGQPSIKLPQDLVLDYAGSDGSVFQYSRGGAGGVVGGAAATISCQEEEGGGCRGEAYGAAGQVYVLDYCGQQEGHVWKQLDLSTNYEEVRRERALSKEKQKIEEYRSMYWGFPSRELNCYTTIELGLEGGGGGDNCWRGLGI
jgi:hypothetical protein